MQKRLYNLAVLIVLAGGLGFATTYYYPRSIGTWIAFAFVCLMMALYGYLSWRIGRRIARIQLAPLSAAKAGEIAVVGRARANQDLVDLEGKPFIFVEWEISSEIKGNDFVAYGTYPEAFLAQDSTGAVEVKSDEMDAEEEEFLYSWDDLSETQQKLVMTWIGSSTDPNWPAPGKVTGYEVLLHFCRPDRSLFALGNFVPKTRERVQSYPGRSETTLYGSLEGAKETPLLFFDPARRLSVRSDAVFSVIYGTLGICGVAWAIVLVLFRIGIVTPAFSLPS